MPPVLLVRSGFALALLALGSLAGAGRASAGDAPPPADVKKAIDRGVEWLRGQAREGFEDRTFHEPVELVVLTLAHCGANLSDPAFAKSLALVEKAEPRWTYRTALKAMALAEVNPRLYQSKIAHCAQWFVDTQLAGGEWGYPGPPEGSYLKTEGVQVAPPPAEEGKPADAPREKVAIARKVPATNYGTAKGDFSNTQFAILGLRAAREAGVEVPKETWKGAFDYLKAFQRKDGGWGYVIGGTQDDGSYASLTCAGVCSAAICLHALGAKDPKSDPVVSKGLGWLKKNLDVAVNAGIDTSATIQPRAWQYYHLYSLERAARVLSLSKVEGRAWYEDGARWILSHQESDGSWQDVGTSGPQPAYYHVADTCFALLFLTRATRPLTGE